VNVYFGQFCLEMPEGAEKEYLYFPYSVGCIWAYANSHPEVQKNFELKDFFIRKDDPTQIVDSLDNPKLFGFSSYVWNINYNLHLAKLVKERYPECVIFFGGPQIPVGDEDWLKDNPQVDYALYREGEIVFHNLLRRTLGMEHETKGMGFLVNGAINKQQSPERIKDLSTMPSPYTAGYFDSLISKYRGTNVVLNATLETNRGCPFGCTFCDWGNGALGKVKKFDLCRVHEEVEWMGKNNIDYVWCADANFGAFKQRDLELSKFIVEVNKKYGYPKTFYTNWHKNQSDGIVDIAQILLDSGIMRSFNLSLQSTNNNTLDAIKRTNVSPAVFEKIIALSKEKDYTMSTDLMLPLPLETKQSYLEAIDYCYSVGIDPNFSPVTILPGSEMNDAEYRQRYGLVTQKTKFGNPDTNPWVSEEEEVIVATNAMTKQEFNQLLLIGYLMEHLHLMGFTDLIACYYHKTENMKYTDFYEKLLAYILKSPDNTLHYHLNKHRNHVDDKLTSNLLGGINFMPVANKIGVENREKFYSEIKDFCREGLPENINLNDLISLQYNWQNHNKNESETVMECRSNLYDYLTTDTALLKQKETSYRISSSGIPKTFKTFGEYVLWGRYLKKWKNKIVVESN